LLVLDEPFEGLDAESRHKLAASIRGLVHSGLQMILATHRWDYILPEFSHVLGLKDGAVFCQGLRKEILNRHHIEKLYGRPSVLLDSKRTTVSNSPGSVENKETPLIQLKNVTVQYGNQVVFKDLTWTVHKGDNWAVSGPNGSGKTTLLQIIAGDHPQAYANEIYLFGRRRGSGESIWEIKQRIGLVSSEFQIAYRKPIRALDVVVSGFFDSIGLYRYASQQQRKAAQQWIERLALTHLQDKRFDLLSYGERRLILLARAMVKTPDLLVLDEPCQGLDPTNRRLVRDCVDGMIFQTTTQLLYVTHFTEEIPGCITHHFDLSQQSA
jgi:molybdate transport system ATP-binding protein